MSSLESLNGEKAVELVTSLVNIASQKFIQKENIDVFF